MAEYALGIYRLVGHFPWQILMYVGEAPLQMPAELKAPGVLFQYEMIDFRDLDGERRLSSDDVGDNALAHVPCIAILARLQDRKAAVHRIIGKLSNPDIESKELYLVALLTLAGLRGLEDVVEQEARRVPILNDILEHKVLGREFKRGIEQGRRGPRSVKP
ncbi:MAG: hypothetical protein ACR2NN_22815 [Bryobacteraceae bacterium]